MNRRKWAPQSDEDRAELARMDVLREQRDRIDKEILEQARRMRDRRIPGEEIARRAGMSEATLYRKIGASSTASNG